MRSPILNRQALFDIGVAGPIAGFVVAVIALVIGLRWSTVVVDQGFFGLRLGEPLLLQFFSWLVLGPTPEGYDVILHPVAFAAWFGLFVTSLNLIPIGQLDGGHVAYALWGNRQRSIALAVVPVLLFLGFIGWPGWFLWAGMAGILGLAHPPVMDPETRLGPIRMWIGWAAIAIFALTFAPVPLPGSLKLPSLIWFKSQQLVVMSRQPSRATALLTPASMPGSRIDRGPGLEPREFMHKGQSGQGQVQTSHLFQRDTHVFHKVIDEKPWVEIAL